MWMENWLQLRYQHISHASPNLICQIVAQLNITLSSAREWLDIPGATHQIKTCSMIVNGSLSLDPRQTMPSTHFTPPIGAYSFCSSFACLLVNWGHFVRTLFHYIAWCYLVYSYWTRWRGGMVTLHSTVHPINSINGAHASKPIPCVHYAEG